MNAKTNQKYKLIISLAQLDAKDPTLPASLAELCANDFQTAFEMWEYLLAKYQSELKSLEICENLEIKPFQCFLRVSETKTKALLCESLPLIKLVYGTCTSAGSGQNLALLVNLILSGKPESAEEFFRCLKSNPNINYNELMRVIVDNVFATYCSRNAVKVPNLNKKQKTLLLEYIAKVKGANKALLTQRIKEL